MQQVGRISEPSPTITSLETLRKFVEGKGGDTVTCHWVNRAWSRLVRRCITLLLTGRPIAPFNRLITRSIYPPGFLFRRNRDGDHGCADLRFYSLLWR